MLDALELPREWLPPAHESTEIGAAGDQAAGALGRRRRPAGTALGRARHLGRRLRGPAGVPARARGRLHAFCHAVPADVARDGRHALGRRVAAVAARATIGAPPYEELFPEAARWEPGAEGLLFQPYLQGERTPHADPDARGAFVGPDAAPRPRRARPCGARGRRLRPARLARAAARARCRGRGRPRLRRRRAQRPLAEDRRLRPRPAARAHGRRGRRRVRRRAPRRRRERRLRGRARGGRGVRPRARPDRARARAGRRPTRRATSATAGSTPRCASSQ